MELKRVEMIGFKSFPEKLSVQFDKGITAIIGPNGSGKSNISDAIRWVLGEQSAKSLRGTKMEDVIFAGTERRRPVGYAQVTLVLDNSDHKIPLAYDEISICRRVYRSGESEYMVNQTRYRLKDILELLMDTGIGKDGYSVIGQGRIDQLLSTKPQERRMIFEEAAGIVKYKTRKEEAAKQLAEEAISLSRVEDRLHDMEQRLGPLAEQAEVAKKYRKLEEELRVYEINNFLDQYKQYNEQYEKSQQQLEAVQKDLEEAAEKQEEAKRLSAKYAEEAEDAQKAVMAIRDQLTETMLAQETAEGERKLAQQQQETLERELTEGAKRLEEVKIKLAERSQTLRKEEKLIEHLKQENQEKEELQKNLMEQDRAAAEAVLLCDQKLVAKDKELTNLEKKLQETEGEHQRLSLQIEHGENLLEDADERILTVTQSQEEKQELLNTQNHKIEEQRQVLEKLDQQYKVADAQVQTIRSRIRDTQQAQEEILREIRAAQDRIRWLTDLENDYEGFSGSVKMVMQLKKQNPQQWSAVRGTVSDVITVPTALSTALDIALGTAVQNIIVENQNTARDLIEILRRRQGGRATFQPMDVVSERDHGRDAAQILAQPGVVGFADDLIRYDRQYHGIVSRLLGNVVVVEEYDVGARLAKRYNKYYRIVTRKGDIFNIGGSITGGSIASKGSNILSRRGEKEELTQQLEARRQQGRDMQNQVSELAKQRERLQMQSEDIRDQQIREQKTMQQLQQELAQITFIKDQLDQQQRVLEKEQQTASMRIEDQKGRLETIAEELKKLQKQEMELRLVVQTLKAGLEEKRTDRENLRTQLMQTRIEINGLLQQKNAVERTMEWEYAEAESLSSEADTLLDKAAAAKESKQNLIKSLQEIEEQQKKRTEAIEKLNAKILVLEKAKTDKDRQREEGIRDSEETIRIYSGLEKEQVRLEGAFNRAKKDLTTLQDQIWEKYEITYNAALAMAREDLGSKAHIARQISMLRSEIRKLGNVNLRAVEEYEILSEKYAMDTMQRDDIVKATESLQQIIDQLTKKMEEQFTEGFKKIADSFNVVFRKLFGGGKGVLKLTEDAGVLESGIEIVAQPPGKKLQSMMLLSGGERTLTAIALLFAIQQLNPAPFCILDEIEAALDDANVVRYAEYLKELCDKTQFIVITHRKGTMEAAHTMYGVTMEEKGISKCFSIQFQDGEEMEWMKNGTV